MTRTGSETASERLFREYLDHHGLEYDRDFVVGPTGKDVDFFVSQTVLCEVKELRRRQNPSDGEIEADVQIRNDLGKLSNKLKGCRLDKPAVLVTVNLECEPFLTGFSVVAAMRGDFGVLLEKSIGPPAEVRNTSGIIHLPRGHAALTKTHKTSISGVFVLDGAGRHVFFTNPYAAASAPDAFFPESTTVAVDRHGSAELARAYAEFTFWPVRRTP